MRKLLLAATLGLVSASRPGFAQGNASAPFQQPVGFVLPNGHRARADSPQPATVVRGDEDEGIYFITGGVLGGIAGGLVAAIKLWKCSDCSTVPMVLVWVGGGTVAGALLGSVIYRFRGGS